MADSNKNRQPRSDANTAVPDSPRSPEQAADDNLAMAGDPSFSDYFRLAPQYVQQG